jgi:hypothetical protein
MARGRLAGPPSVIARPTFSFVRGERDEDSDCQEGRLAQRRRRDLPLADRRSPTRFQEELGRLLWCRETADSCTIEGRNRPLPAPESLAQVTVQPVRPSDVCASPVVVFRGARVGRRAHLCVLRLRHRATLCLLNTPRRCLIATDGRPCPGCLGPCEQSGVRTACRHRVGRAASTQAGIHLDMVGRPALDPFRAWREYQVS